MKITKNRLALPLGRSCTYCDNYWGIMELEDYETVYYDPADDSIICKVCHETYGSADSKEDGTMTWSKREYTFQNIEDFFLTRGSDNALFDADKAIAFLLLEGELYLNTRKYVENDWDPKDKWYISDKQTTVIFLNCSDTICLGSR